MSNTNSAAVNKVPMGQKIAFGLGMLANQMFPAALGIFMVVLVQDLKFPGWMWGILFFLPRVFDAFTDPIMGYISDNTRSKWGRRRHYVFAGAIVMGISFVIMWQLYRDNGVSYNFIFFLIWSFLFYLGLTLFSVPYVAMGYEMSDDFHERTSIMAVAQWIGQWAWVIAPWFWVVMYDPEWFPNADTATRTLAIWVGVICMILAMVPAIFIKSRSTLNDTSLKHLSFKTIGGSLVDILKSFKEAFIIKPFRKLCIATFLIFNAFNTVAGFTFFIVVYYLFNGNSADAGVWPTLFGSVGALATTFIVIPIVAWISKKMEKKKAFLICQGISIFGYILFWFLFVPGKPYMFLFALPFFSFGIGSLFTLMMSMTADVCDMDELTSGKRREGIFGAIYWWMVKFGFAVAGLLTGVIMSLVGFDASAATQADGAITGLRLFFSGIPILGTLGAIWVMWGYDLNEKKANEIKKELERRKAPRLSSAYQAGKLKPLINGIHLPAYAGTDFSNKQSGALSVLFREQLGKGVYGLCFSPYIEGQDSGDVLIESEIKQRMAIVSPHTRWVRSFSCTKGNELIPIFAKEKGLKTMVGAWISNDRERNEKEINALIKLCREGLVDIAVIGNEVLLRGELSAHEVTAYMKKAKEQINNIPVGYVDAYYQFVENPELAAASDVILVNCYPFWEGSTIEQSLEDLRRMYAVTKNVAQGKRIMISETGWPSKGGKVNGAEPSAVNAQTYFLQVQEWAQKEGIELFYFSSFDETWKIKEEGELGARWGIWDKDENLKF
ncbi:MAG TPA: MFS transporter [Chitinophagaceae bacterium]|nr:MFS transporter [Chitinophagaceae bacterium]HNU13208.1 MFS transporter [Chitinophagaceae bacterium]